MIIDDVYTYLIAEVSGLTANNTFKSFMPDSPGNCVCVYNTGGAEPNRDIPTGDPTFQILVRNRDYLLGHALMIEIVGELHQKKNIELVAGENYFYNIMLMGEPGHLGRDKKKRDEFSVNFIAHTRGRPS